MRILFIAILGTLVAAHTAQASEGMTGDAFAGFGFGGFTSGLGGRSVVGGTWMVRAGFNPSRYIGVEASYQGASNELDTVIPNGATISGSYASEQQITGNLKISYPLPAGFRPYAFAGAGYGHVTVNSALNSVGLSSADAATFPFGAGVSYDISQHLVIDARYTYSVLTASVGNTWNVAFNFGARFGQTQ